MSQKRKLAEAAGGDAPAQKSFKKSRPNFKPGGHHPKAKGFQPRRDEGTTSIGALKSRVRDLKRMLEHVDSQPKNKMPANIRIDRERELAACEHEIAEKTAAAREAEYRNKIIGKYHHVRFFDRQKATRILKRLRRELSNLEDESQRPELLQKIHDAEVDTNYPQYYPLMKPYSALYPKTKREKSNSEEPTEGEDNSAKEGGHVSGPKGDPDMWKAIERAMEDGTLDELRNSKADMPDYQQRGETREKEKKRKHDKKKKEASEAKQRQNETMTTDAREDDEGSDGGFFE
ncbi:hypothetical protein P154DRAFT_574708 [Amniculicola lignicola CBS 123094]|uniref:rRNA-processing protein EFG1 n=1 Tax=Amniculicola lignicola CBS 123094 TaxID=1392246 RepID=A0A6A5WL41_9PLEO|nr:hypothetical protein P154DRAFT_574708 [Amniculicola lignicola CBS 123094]